MADINFPSSPSVNDTYTFGGITYTYTSRLVWKANALGSFTGPTGPTGAASTVTGPTGLTGPTGPQYVVIYPGWFA